MDAGTVVLVLVLLAGVVLIGGLASGISRRRRGTSPQPPGVEIVDRPTGLHVRNNDLAQGEQEDQHTLDSGSSVDNERDERRES